jgi:2-alkyl-3-oxoalkanoate reductase
MTARTVAVTGATGFLGLHLLAALAREGANIRILARRDQAPDFAAGIAFETILGSLEDEAALVRLVHGADAVVHCAGLIKAQDRGAFLRANRDGAAALAQAARQHAPQARFIYVSTLAAREPHLSDYAFSKRAGEGAVRAVYAGAESQLVIIRPPALYGPWDKATLPIFQSAVWPVAPVFGRGQVTVLHVADAAAALARLAMGAGGPGLFTLPGTHLGLDAVTAAAARAQGRAARMVHIPPFLLRAAGAASALWGRLRGQAPVFSKGKAREMLFPDWAVSADEALPAAVYQPRIGLDEGFASTVAWYRQQGWLT